MEKDLDEIYYLRKDLQEKEKEVKKLIEDKSGSDEKKRL